MTLGNIHYDFKEQEFMDLVRLLWRNEENLPESLKEMEQKFLKITYEAMTIDEAENFFNETNS